MLSCHETMKKLKHVFMINWHRFPFGIQYEIKYMEYTYYRDIAIHIFAMACVAQTDNMP